MRVALYIRVSTDEQAKSGYSIPDQERTLREHAQREGHEVVETITDDGYPGASRERPGLELAEAGQIELAIATKRDRIFRSRLYHLTPDRVRPKTEEELADERLAAGNERSARLRHLYEAIGLSVTAHKDGTHFLRWSCGQRALPSVTRSESPVLRRIFAPDDG